MKQRVQGSELVSELFKKLVHGTSLTKKAVKMSQILTALSKAKMRNVTVEERVPLTVAASGVVNRVVYEYNRFIVNGKL